jgi:hypothetical protein
MEELAVSDREYEVDLEGDVEVLPLLDVRGRCDRGAFERLDASEARSSLGVIEGWNLGS